MTDEDHQTLGSSSPAFLVIEKARKNIVYSTIYWDADQGFYYVKRFELDATEKAQSFVNGNPESKLISLTEVEYPRFEIEFGGKHKEKDKAIIEVAEFIGIKSFKAKGKRLTNFNVDNIKEIEPVVKKESDPVTQAEISEEPGKGTDEDSPADDPAQMKLGL